MSSLSPRAVTTAIRCTFRSAANGRFLTKAKDAARTVVLNGPHPRKKK